MDVIKKSEKAPVVVENKSHSPQIQPHQPGVPQPMEQLDPNQWFKKDPGKSESSRYKLNGWPIKKIIFILAVFFILGGAVYFAFGMFDSANKLAESNLSEEKGGDLTPPPASGSTDEPPNVPDEPTTNNPGNDDDEKPVTDDGDKPSDGGSTGGGSGGGSTPAPPEPLPKTYAITYKNSCYKPADRTIEEGDTIRFLNDSNKIMWPITDNNRLPTLNPGKGISSGGSWKYTFHYAGNWGYHDKNRPHCDGTITVKK